MRERGRVQVPVNTPIHLKQRSFSTPNPPLNVTPFSLWSWLRCRRPQRSVYSDAAPFAQRLDLSSPFGFQRDWSNKQKLLYSPDCIPPPPPACFKHPRPRSYSLHAQMPLLDGAHVRRLVGWLGWVGCEGVGVCSVCVCTCFCLGMGVFMVCVHFCIQGFVCVCVQCLLVRLCVYMFCSFVGGQEPDFSRYL